MGCGGGVWISQNIQEEHSIHLRVGGYIAANQLLSNYPKLLFTEIIDAAGRAQKFDTVMS